MYSTWLYSDLEYNCCCCLWAFTFIFCLHACKNAYQYLQSHLMLTNMCIHCCCIQVVDTHIQSIGRPTVYITFMSYVHTPLYLCHTCTLLGTHRFSGISPSPCWSCKTLLSKMLTAIGTHTGSLVFSFGIVVIFYIPLGCVICFMHTCASYVWLL